MNLTPNSFGSLSNLRETFSDSARAAAAAARRKGGGGEGQQSLPFGRPSASKKSTGSEDPGKTLMRSGATKGAEYAVTNHGIHGWSLSVKGTPHGPFASRSAAAAAASTHHSGGSIQQHAMTYGKFNELHRGGLQVRIPKGSSSSTQFKSPSKGK